MAVHPHARGEHSRRRGSRSTESGSSPRSWGTRFGASAAHYFRRFIPTLVGNTTWCVWVYCPLAVHPHARGEHSSFQHIKGGECGSSPRSWGTPQSQVLTGWQARFIPTLVGNTRRLHALTNPKSVHPHARGEHSSRLSICLRMRGSSPRSWGTLYALWPPGIVRRFIPTLVGNTHSNDGLPRARSVHPHARGEHRATTLASCATRGSSPRSWGTPVRGDVGFAENRFIPTLVGNT